MKDEDGRFGCIAVETPDMTPLRLFAFAAFTAKNFLDLPSIRLLRIRGELIFRSSS